MSGNPTPSFSASDSGFLKSLKGVNGYDALLRERAGSVRRLDEARLSLKRAGSPAENAAAPSDAEIEQRLRAAAVPPGLIERLRRRLQD